MTESPSLMLALTTLVTALLYLLAAWRQVLQLDQHRHHSPRGISRWGIAAVAAHLVTVLIAMSDSAINLGIYRMTSFIFLSMGILTVLISLWRPLQIMSIVLFPLAALSILVATFAPATGRPLASVHPGIQVHIVASVIAYAVLTLAACQGLLVSFQIRNLRQHKTRGVIRHLPALDTMERSFYELISAATSLLLVAMISGGIYIDDLFAQHLVHKTVLTLLGFIALLVILIIQWRQGWRVNSAVTLLISAYILISLGFFGSKLVLELILNTASQ